MNRRFYKKMHRWSYPPTAVYVDDKAHPQSVKVRRLPSTATMSLQPMPKDFVLSVDMVLIDRSKMISNLSANGVARAMGYFLAGCPKKRRPAI